MNLAKVTSFFSWILPDMAINSFHQRYAMSMRKAQETSSVRLLAVTTWTHHILTHHIITSLTASHSSYFTLISTLSLTQSKTFQAKAFIVCFLAQEMKGIVISSQEFPEQLLAHVHFYYNFRHSKSCKCETSFKLSSCSLPGPQKNFPIIDIYQHKVLSAVPFLSSCTGQDSVADVISGGKYYCQCSSKALPPAVSKWGMQRENRKESRTEGF